MASNVVLMSFLDSSKAYEALSKLRQLNDDNTVSVHSAVVVSRDADGKLSVQDGDGADSAGGLLGGGLIGALIGILGGPLGVIFGWAAGALIGGTADAASDDDSLSLLDAVSQAIVPGSTALIAHVDEDSPAAIDGLASAEGGAAQRWDAEQVSAELDAAESAASSEAKQARKEARQAKKDQKEADRQAKYAARKAQSASGQAPSDSPQAS